LPAGYAAPLRREAWQGSGAVVIWGGFPKSLKIIGKRYKLRIVEKVDDEDSDGESCPVDQVIKVKEAHGFENARDTALHEAIHGVDHQMHLALTEQQVEGLGTGMLALLRENPAFVRWLMAKERESG
jgi:hypothetical protein